MTCHGASRKSGFRVTTLGHMGSCYLVKAESDFTKISNPSMGIRVTTVGQMYVCEDTPVVPHVDP